MSSTPAYRLISEKEAVRLMEKDTGTTLLDVRTPREYESGHIPGAINIPVESIALYPSEKLPNPDSIIIVYCRSGVRSAAAAHILIDRGFKNLNDLGGIMDWTGAIVSGKLPS